jgi:hypothetical protein
MVKENIVLERMWQSKVVHLIAAGKQRQTNRKGPESRYLQRQASSNLLPPTRFHPLSLHLSKMPSN